MSDVVTPDQINEVLRLVAKMTPNGDGQLTILSVALVVACRSCQAKPDIVFENLTELFERRIDLAPLFQ